MTSVTGDLVTEACEYDGGRPVTVYIPRDPPQVVVFAGDGQLIPQWGGVLEASGVPPTMIVGAHRLDDETLRLQEYSPGFDRLRAELAATDPRQRVLVADRGECVVGYAVVRPSRDEDSDDERRRARRLLL